MKIDIGIDVRTIDGEDIGKVERVVVNPDSKEVDALVVRKGLLLTRDVVVPMTLVQGVDDKAVTLRIGIRELHQLPDFIERHYVQPAAHEIPTYPYAPGSVVVPLAPVYGVGAPSVYQPVEEVGRIPPEDVDISEGTEVRALDGTIGVVDQVLTDVYTDKVQSIVVRKGLLLRKEVQIPVEVIAEVADDHVKLSLTREQIEALPMPEQDRYIHVEGDEDKQE